MGCWLLLDSVFVRFAREGRGTLAPIDPVRFVVRGGAYRVVRNPMYLAAWRSPLFGDDYEAYRRAVHRWIPRWQRRHTSDS